MLISSHDLNHMTEVCERIVVLDQGVVVKDIETSEKTLEELERYFFSIATISEFYFYFYKLLYNKNSDKKL